MTELLGARAVGVVGVLVAASLAVGVGGSALAEVTVDFEQYPPGTVLTGQYANQGGAGQGVVFGPLPAGAGVGDGLRPVIRTPPTGQAQSGLRVADIATCIGCEFFTPRTTGTLFVPRSRLSVYVGYLGEPAICTAIDPNAVGCAIVRLRAFNATGGQVAESSVRVTRGAGIRSLLSVSTPSATIVGFEISGRPALDDSKPIATDDLVFGTPDPAPAPDFTLNPATANVIVEQGEEVTVPIAIGRLNGSSGDIALRAEGLPQGVVATFAPNPAPAAQTVLTLTARADAPTARRPISITGTPQSASAGPAPRNFTVDLTVQPACPQVGTADELIAKLMKGHKCIYVKDPAQIDLADVPNNPLSDGDSVLVVPDGVTLMGGRSPTHAGGMLELSRRIGKPIMLRLGSNTRVTGLRLRGYNQRDPKDRDDPTRGIQINGGSGVVIENNEIFGWPAEGVEAIDTPTDFQTTPRITRNFIHNNVQCNLGYGVVLSGNGFARIDRNVFNYNRHDVAGSGQAGQGYLAERNLVLTSGPTCGGNYNQHFDMHGTKGGTGGTAGRLIEIRRNTIRGAQRYAFNGRLVRPAFELRGTPQNQAVFAENAVAHGRVLKQHTAFGGTVSSSGAVRVKGASATSLLLKKKLVLRANQTCVNTAKELAVGDFNGDGRADVFQAVGTVWVYSPSGQREWLFLKDSNLRLARLGLGDFDGDGKTDVFYQEGARWLVSSGGTSASTPLPAGSSIDVKGYRFGDLDGDGKTDVFRTSGSRFFFSRAGATRWQPLAASRLSIGELRFGDFDGDGKTDVFSLANNQWSVSDGGNSAWRRLNKKLSSSLGSLAFADFNGDRRTDVARSSSGNWQVSWGGATAWQTLQFRRSESLAAGMLFGDFTGDGRGDVLQHASIGGPSPLCGAAIGSFERFRLSAGGARPPARWSSADLR